MLHSSGPDHARPSRHHRGRVPPRVLDSAGSGGGSNAPFPHRRGRTDAHLRLPDDSRLRGPTSSCTATLVHEEARSPSPSTASKTTRPSTSSSATRRSCRRGAVAIASCKGDDLFDFAYCVLAQEVTDVPIVPILYGCRSRPSPSVRSGLVGFGLIGANTPVPRQSEALGRDRGCRYPADQPGRRRPTTAPVPATREGRRTSAARRKLARVGREPRRPGRGRVRRAERLHVHARVRAVDRAAVGLDVTPCYDATGAWSPGPKCTGFPMNPEVSDGTWAHMCTENLLV